MRAGGWGQTFALLCCVLFLPLLHPLHAPTLPEAFWGFLRFGAACRAGREAGEGRPLPAAWAQVRPPKL